MTTTIAFATRDCVVLGSDSLGTVPLNLVDPFRLISFFDAKDNFSIRKDANGEPLLKHFGQIYQHSEEIAYNQLPSMTKIFSLEPAIAGVVFAGVSVLQNKSIRELIESFVSTANTDLAAHTMKELTDLISEFIKPTYEEAFKNRSTTNITLELTVAGYGATEEKPEVFKIWFADGKIEIIPMVKTGQYDIVWGGQYDIVQRVVTGLDWINVMRFEGRVTEIATQYREKLLEHLKAQQIQVDLPEIADFANDINIKDLSWINRSGVDPANFSEQAAIDFVDFMVETMIKAQHFSDRLQTVGGKVHIALITKSGGFRWISKEQYTHKGHEVPKHEIKPLR